MVVVFLPILEHPSASLSFNVRNPLKPENQSSNLEIEALTSKMSTELQDFDLQENSFLTFQASMDVKYDERESGETWWQIWVQNGAWSVGR